MLVGTHADFYVVAAAIDDNGVTLGIESFPADAGNHRLRLAHRADMHGFDRLLGVEAEDRSIQPVSGSV